MLPKFRTQIVAVYIRSENSKSKLQTTRSKKRTKGKLRQRFQNAQKLYNLQLSLMFENRRNWSDFDRAILSLVKKHGTRNWAEISEKMSSKYGIDCRTGKQCRERWHNHLNPDINKNAWTEREEKAMFEAHQQHGNKWTEIARHFPGRTDNDIKNHFYSMLRRSLRRCNKLLGLRNSTQRIKLIKPSVLSRIFSNTDSASNDWKEISSALFEFSKTRTVEGMGKGLNAAEKRRMEELIEKIAAYNEEYEQGQLERKESRRSEKREEEQKKEKERLSEEHEDGAAGVKKQFDSEEDQLPEVLLPNKKKSSLAKGKTKKIRRQPNPKKKASQATPPSSSPKKLSKRGRKKKQPIPMASQSTNVPLAVGEPQAPLTRLKRRESQISFKLEEFMPDMWELPELELSKKKSSLNGDSRRSGSSFFNAASPRMDLRIFARTPPGPTPTALTRNLMSFDWKANNEELDQIVSQTRKAIERMTG